MFGLFQKFRDSLSNGPERSRIYYLLPQESRDYLDPITREEVTRRVEAMMDSFGMVKEGIRGTARHTVGQTWVVSMTVVIAQSGHGTACRSSPSTLNTSVRSAA